MKNKQEKRAMRKKSGIRRRKAPLRRSLCQSGSRWDLMRGRSLQAGPSSDREVPLQRMRLPLCRTGLCIHVSRLIATEVCLICLPCSRERIML